jgi:hypothetical protein
MATAAASVSEEDLEVEIEPKFCSGCEKNLENEPWERCNVCQLVVCPSCDIRGKDPTKPACRKHA